MPIYANNKHNNKEQISEMTWVQDSSNENLSMGTKHERYTHHLDLINEESNSRKIPVNDS